MVAAAAQTRFFFICREWAGGSENLIFIKIGTLGPKLQAIQNREKKARFSSTYQKKKEYNKNLASPNFCLFKRTWRNVAEGRALLFGFGKNRVFSWNGWFW
jgi:hypothetical protein